MWFVMQISGMTIIVQIKRIVNVTVRKFETITIFNSGVRPSPKIEGDIRVVNKYNITITKRMQANSRTS